jgi:glycosyltransferase involved in cell wall biosynthesis
VGGATVRTAVYNRYWSTGGGAEKYGGVIAQILSGDGPLDLLTHEPVDVDWLAERLHLDLAKVDVRVVDDEPGAVTRASRDYDLFVNVSYLSADRAGTSRSIYVVHFPAPLDGHLGAGRRLLAKVLGGPRHLDGMEWGDGFHLRDPGPRSVAWTSGEGTLRFVTRPGHRLHLSLVFGRQRPPQLGPATVRIEVDGETRAEVQLTAPTSRLDGQRGTVAGVDLESPADGVPVEVKIVSDTFVPAEVLGTDDRRRLGVPLKALRFGRGPVARLTDRFPMLLGGAGSAAWTRSYGALVSNSEFTRGWVDRWWGTDSDVLFPPVTMHEPAAAKEPVILNVGRFFAAEHGHSKKQLELVKAFRRLCDRGTRGWTLHLVGGCADSGRGYFEQVRQAAEGYPVELHPNARGDELEALYGAASIYWHASGLGENPGKHPARLEHFGITTAEAMSAGAVPVVIGLAGQLETVRHGVDGYHFTTLDGLCAQTEALIRDEGLRATMSASACRRARDFSVEAFEGRLRAVVERVLQEPDADADAEPDPDGAQPDPRPDAGC